GCCRSPRRVSKWSRLRTEAAGAGVPTERSNRHEYEAPRPSMTTTIRADAERRRDDAVEAPMLEIWRDCFESPAIGTDDDFFVLGGDSLRAILLIGLCNDRFGTTLPASAVIEPPTAARLADAVAAAKRRRPPSSVVSLKEGREGAALLLIHPIGGTLFFYAHPAPPPPPRLARSAV